MYPNHGVQNDCATGGACGGRACSGRVQRPRAAAAAVTAGVTAAAAAGKWLEGLINHPAVVGCDDVALNIIEPMALYWENQVGGT
jgi:hypothetical protein